MKLTFTDSVSIDGVAFGGITPASYEGGGGASLKEEPAPVGTTQMFIAIDVSAVKGVMLYSDRAVTIKTNSSGSPDDTIALKAGKPYRWNLDSYDALLLGTDVVSIFVVNASGGSAKISAYAAYDPTPA